jgi:hypothetical protein
MLKLFADNVKILERLETMQRDTKWWNIQAKISTWMFRF